MPKQLVYGSPSGAGKAHQVPTTLQKWGERMVAVGIGTDLALIADCHALTQLERTPRSSAKAADRAAVLRRTPHGRCSPPIAAPFAPPCRGRPGRRARLDPRAETGRCSASTVGCRHRSSKRGVTASNAGARDARRRGLVRRRRWRLAGTLDRIARCTKTLRFALITGEIVGSLPAPCSCST